MAIVKRGKNIYLIRVYIGRDSKTGKRIQINKTVYGTLSDAKKEEAVLKSKKHSGKLTNPSKITVDDLFDRYQKSVRHTIRESTKNKNKKYFNYYVSRYIGNMLIKNIKTSDIQDLINLLLDRKLKPSTVRMVKKILNPSFNFAVDEKLIPENPVAKVKLPPLNKSSADSLTVEESKKFVKVRDTFWFGIAFVFQLHTGLRPQELLALIWGDIDFGKGTVRVERACMWPNETFIGFGPPKRKRSYRTISLAPKLLKLLKTHYIKQRRIIDRFKRKGLSYGEIKVKEWINRERENQIHLYKSTDLIFPKPDGTVPHAATPRLELKAMLRRAGINRKNFRFYDLRHTHATILLSNGEPIHEVAARLGNSVTELLTTYAHLLEQRRGSAALLFQRLVPL